MNSLDRIVAKGIKSVLEEDLGKVTYNKVEREVFDVFGMTVLEAVSDFPKIDLALRKFFGKHTTNIESKIFKKIISIEKNTKTESTLTIKDPIVAKTIFESYGDPVKKIILDILIDNPKSIPETIAASKLPKASAYTRIKEMIQDGLLTMVGHTNAADGRKINEYAVTFSKATFEIQSNGMTVNVNMPNKFLKDSFTFNSIYESMQ